MAGYPRITLLVSAGVLLLAHPLSAQLKLGDLSLTANGNVQPGYTANYGNSISRRTTGRSPARGRSTGPTIVPDSSLSQLSLT